MIFQWEDIQVGEQAFSVRKKINTMGKYSSNLISSIQNVTIPVSAWELISSDAPYRFKASIDVDGISETSIVFAAFSLSDQLSNNFTSGESEKNKLNFYAIEQPVSNIKIPNIVIFEVGV